MWKGAAQSQKPQKPDGSKAKRIVDGTEGESEEVSTNIISFDFTALPDTGATRSIISLDLVKRFNFKIHPCREKLFAADNSPLKCEGTCFIKINQVKVNPLISSSIKDDLIISLA